MLASITKSHFKSLTATHFPNRPHYCICRPQVIQAPLLKKLGIIEDTRVFVVNPPGNYYQLLEKNISDQLVSKSSADLVHLFVTSDNEFEIEMKKLKPVYQSNPLLVIWVSWFKKSAGMKTDMTENVIRNYALENGLVDVKVCSVSELWSALKLVVPKAMT